MVLKSFRDFLNVSTVYRKHCFIFKLKRIMFEKKMIFNSITVIEVSDDF